MEGSDNPSTTQEARTGPDKQELQTSYNLPLLSKVVVKCALKQFTKHCDENGLLPTYQSAYRKNYSCKTALVKPFDYLLWSME